MYRRKLPDKNPPEHCNIFQTELEINKTTVRLSLTAENFHLLLQQIRLLTEAMVSGHDSIQSVLRGHNLKSQ
jgi:hypothetical protein